MKNCSRLLPQSDIRPNCQLRVKTHYRYRKPLMRSRCSTPFCRDITCLLSCGRSSTRVAPKTPNGTTIEGYTSIPGGVTVSSNAYAIHRIAEVFPEPDAWVPERWLITDRKQLEQMRRCFLAFGAGGRRCLGSKISIQGIYTSLHLMQCVILTVEQSYRNETSSCCSLY